jgi:hypothetical protein
MGQQVNFVGIDNPTSAIVRLAQAGNGGIGGPSVVDR